MKEKKDTQTQPYKFSPNASVHELKEFMSGHLWQDIVKYIQWKQEGSLDVLKTDPDHRIVLRMQGAIEVAEDILSLPERMIEWIEVDDIIEDTENA